MIKRKSIRVGRKLPCHQSQIIHVEEIDQDRIRVWWVESESSYE